MNNTTSFSIAGLSALIAVYALYFVGVLLGADFYAPALDQQIPTVAFAALTIFSTIVVRFGAKRLKGTTLPSEMSGLLQ